MPSRSHQDIDAEDVRELALRKAEFKRFMRARSELLKSLKVAGDDDDANSAARPKSARRLDEALGGPSKPTFASLSPGSRYHVRSRRRYRHLV